MAKGDTEILQMALIGYAEQRRVIDTKIAAIQEQIAGPSNTETVSRDGRKPRRKLSAAGKRRIREAARKRWAAVRAANTEEPIVTKAATSKRTKPRRKLSAEARAKLVANLKKARAARAAKRSAGEMETTSS